MKQVACPRQMLQDQELNHARSIIRARKGHSAGTIIIAMRSIARLSAHPYEIDAAHGALASRQVAA